MTDGERPWLAALEGYYGPPLDPDERAELARWLAGRGYDAFVYAPKDDPYQRARWREPYPPAERAALETVAAACHDAGIDFGFTISPGLDWRAGDTAAVDALVAKLESLLSLEPGVVGIAWDDTPGHGADLGAEHGRAVRETVERVGADAVRWFTCPVDYAVEEPTPYLTAFAEALRGRAEIMWTGPSVLTHVLTAAHTTMLSEALGQRLLFAENFPVNDAGMRPVLHLGPYPEREAAAMAATTGVIANFMSRPRASRVGLALTARAWLDPTEDREQAWRDEIARIPGLEPLARACRSWLDDPGPDPELLEWAEHAGPADRRLREFLDAGCREGLEPALRDEVEPWLAAWEREAEVMRLALDVLETDGRPTFGGVAATALAWHAARAEYRQAFGIRFAIYPSTRRFDGEFVPRDDAVLLAENLTDVLVARVLRTTGRTGR